VSAIPEDSEVRDFLISVFPAFRREGPVAIRAVASAQPAAYLKCIAYLAAIEEGPKQEREAFMDWLDGLGE